MTEIMNAWPVLTVATLALFAAARAAGALRSWRPAGLLPVHAFSRNAGDVDPTALLHLRPGPGSIATLAATPERDVVELGQRIAQEERERAAAEAERAEQDAFFADFRAGLDDALATFRQETEHLQRRAKRWHLQCGTDCPECFARADDGQLILRALRVDEPTGEYQLVPAVGMARVDVLAANVGM